MTQTHWFTAFVAAALVFPQVASTQGPPKVLFDHTHTFPETAEYLTAVAKAYPEITRLQSIGKSFLGKDLLVLEITQHKTGDGAKKPAYWIDGNLHAGEVFGGEATLHTIQTLVSGYGADPVITRIVDDYVFYIMPKLNPDGADHYLTRPDGLRSVVRPFDEDGDGRTDEDPGNDLNGDGYITMMRVRDPNGPFRTSAEDPRLMTAVNSGSDPAAWKGEWRVYTEGIDDDGDGRFNEDGVGGIDINRNFPELWLPPPTSFNPGAYPLSEPESRAVADFMVSHKNLTGSINYHMAGNVAVHPPSSLRVDPLSGAEIEPSFDDQQVYRQFGAKAIELNDTAKVQVFKVRGSSPATSHGMIWGTIIDWAYYQLGIFSWIFEVGAPPGAKEIFPSNGREIDRLRWSDENYGGKLFLPWQPFDHPQLGKVEIGGFIGKVYDPRYKTYTNTMMLPGPQYEKLLANHTKWHLFLIQQAPLVRIANVAVSGGENGYFTVTADIVNRGALPTNVTEQALKAEIATPVLAKASVTGGTLVSQTATVTLGHLPARSGAGPGSGRASWVVRAGASASSVTIEAISEKGGTHSRTVPLK
jgi:hypothetical protein